MPICQQYGLHFLVEGRALGKELKDQLLTKVQAKHTMKIYTTMEPIGCNCTHPAGT